MLADVCSLSMGVGFSFLQKHLCFIFAPCHTFLCVCGGVSGSEAPCHVLHSTERMQAHSRLSLDTLRHSPAFFLLHLKFVCLYACRTMRASLRTQLVTRLCHTCATVKPNLIDEMHESGPRLNFISSLRFKTIYI